MGNGRRNLLNKRSGIIAWATILLMVAMPSVVIAQNPNVYALVEYMKVKQGDEQKYVDLETKYWKKIHQERVDKGEIVRWVLYEVRFAGANDEYNYVTVAVVNDPQKLEVPFAGIDPAVTLKGEDVDRIMKETNESRQLVKRNLIYLLSSVPEAGPGPFKYVQIDFMKTKQGSENDYLNLENQVWGPVHNQFVKDGSRTGWSLWQGVYPGGSGMDYQYATANYISDFSKVTAADFNGAFSKAHPGKDINKLMKQTNESRELVRSELWHVLSSVPE